MNIERICAFRKALQERPVIGTFSKTADPAMIEAMSLSGLDFVILDIEHGPNNVLSLQNLIRAAETGNALPFVRVSEGNFTQISATLDIGAAGVQVPQITCAADVRRVREHARFFPQGNRGVCRYVRAAGYSSIEKQAYFRQANEALLILQLEGREALDNLEAIIEEGGMDILFVGPYDLSQSLGVPGEVDHPKVIECVERICSRCSTQGIVAGTFVESQTAARFWIEHGMRYLCYSVDVGLLYQTCVNIKQELLTT